MSKHKAQSWSQLENIDYAFYGIYIFPKPVGFELGTYSADVHDAFNYALSYCIWLNKAAPSVLNIERYKPLLRGAASDEHFNLFSMYLRVRNRIEKISRVIRKFPRIVFVNLDTRIGLE